MIVLDGSYGSGGGQIIRTALALSALTGKSFFIEKIRAKRKNPGLAAQHLSCVKAVAKLCNARVSGAFLGSTKLSFEPGKIETKKLKIDIGTAGSIPLVLQALIPALTQAEEFEIKIKGGTDVKFAPSIDYTKEVFLKLLEKMGCETKLLIEKRGFYPRGGGFVTFRISNSNLKRYDFVEQGKILSLKGNSIASVELKKARVAERQASSALKLLNPSFSIRIKKGYVEADSIGSVITLWLETEKSILGASSLGEKGKRAEEVGKEAAQALMEEIESKAAIDEHAADQLLPYLALTGGSLKTSKISEHAKTNAFVIEKFLPVKFEINEERAIIKVVKE